MSPPVAFAPAPKGLSPDAFRPEGEMRLAKGRASSPGAACKARLVARQSRIHGRCLMGCFAALALSSFDSHGVA
jgi:hypothetical protein